MASPIASIIKELAAVQQKLDGKGVSGPKRLDLLRRQATLGDLRDKARDAERRRLIADR